MFLEVRGENARVRRIGHRFADPQQQPRSHQQHEAMREPGEKRCPGPNHETSAIDPVDVVAIDQPTGRDLQQCVSPEEGGKEPGELLGIEVQFVGHHLAGNRETAAVDIVDADGKHEQTKKDRLRHGQRKLVNADAGSGNAGSSHAGSSYSISVMAVSSSPAPSPGRWLAASVFCLSSTLNYLDRLLLASVAPLIIKEFHLTNEAYGWLASAIALAYALASPLSGIMLDRLGLNRGASLAVGAWSLCCAATSLVHGFGGLVAARFGLGMAESAGIPAVAKMNATYLRPRERAVGAPSAS